MNIAPILWGEPHCIHARASEIGPKRNRGHVVLQSFRPVAANQCPTRAPVNYMDMDVARLGGSHAMPKPEHGSQYDLLQWAVHHTPEFNQRLLDESHTLREFAAGGTIDWLAPDPTTGKELKDGAWAAVGLAPPSPQAAGWWPSSGPTWDGVARVRGDREEVGALFVEAKGHAAELRGGGCKSANADNRQKITDALNDVKGDLGVAPQTDWLGPVYQPANRLGWLWFARHHESHAQAPLPVWLVSVYFCGGLYPWGQGGKLGPAGEAQWRSEIDELHAEMGLAKHPDPLTHHWVELFLPSTVKPPDQADAASG
jgi:hypothetical protein